MKAVKDRHTYIISTAIAEHDDCVVTLELLTKLIGADADVLVCTFCKQSSSRAPRTVKYSA